MQIESCHYWQRKDCEANFNIRPRARKLCWWHTSAGFSPPWKLKWLQWGTDWDLCSRCPGICIETVVENQLFCFKVKSRGNPANVVEIDECRAAPKFGNSFTRRDLERNRMVGRFHLAETVSPVPTHHPSCNSYIEPLVSNKHLHFNGLHNLCRPHAGLCSRARWSPSWRIQKLILRPSKTLSLPHFYPA